MKRIIIVLLLLLAAFFSLKKESIASFVQRIRGQQLLDGKQEGLKNYLCLHWGNNDLGCQIFRLEIMDNDDQANQETSGETMDDPFDSTVQEQPVINPPPSTGHQKNCHMVYVVDSLEQQEQGHYEVIHHPEITKTERSYREYIEYLFYRDDGSYWCFKDYDFTFQADVYLRNHADEFSRYTFSRKYEEVKTVVVVQPAYDETVWVVDIPYRPEMGHYEEICE